MVEPTLTLDEAAAHLGEAVDRARRLGESTLLTDHGEPVARVVPVESAKHTVGELLKWWPTRPRLTPEEADAFAADIEEGRRLSNIPPKSHWDCSSTLPF